MSFLTEPVPLKLLLIGNSGDGKTGAMACLALAGYRLRVINLEGNNINTLRQYVLAGAKARGIDPATLDIDVVSFSDKHTYSRSGLVTNATAYADTMQALTKWPNTEESPSSWGTDTIVVLETLTKLGQSASAWVKKMNPDMEDLRRIAGQAQPSVLKVLETLASADFGPNVIVTTHIDYRTYITGTNVLAKRDPRTGEILAGQDTEERGVPTSIGAAIAHKVGAHFNTVLCARQVKARGKNRRVLTTIPTEVIEGVKVPLNLPEELPIEDGLLTVFKSFGEN